MTDNACHSSLWKLNRTGTEIALHSSLMPDVDWSSSRVSIFYLEPDIALGKVADGPIKANMEPCHRVVKSVTGLGEAVFEDWRSRYLDKQNAGTAAMQLRELAVYEELERGLPDIC